MAEFKPMLAAKTPEPGFKYKFPVLASPKLDGIRAIVREGRLVSRSLKLIPNLHTQMLFCGSGLEGLDGELIVGAPTGRDANGDDVMQRTTKGVMRIEGAPEVTFWTFDYCGGGAAEGAFTFEERLQECILTVQEASRSDLRVVKHVLIENQEQLDAFEAACLENGFEGAMVRDPKGKYKQGRSTAKEGGLIKLKRFEDDEALIIGVERRFHNANEATVDNLGHTKRSTHKENMVPLDELGALICRTKTGVEFNIGTGFSADQRKVFWAEGAGNLIGKFAKYKSFTAAGVKDAPRFPVWLAIRHPEDM